MIRSKTFALAAFAILAAGTASAPSANAGPFWKPIPKPGPCYHCGWGYGAAGLGVGLAAAAVLSAAASANSEADGCWYERRVVDTDDGPRRMRVRVCE
jgi:hypothetical protein